MKFISLSIIGCLSIFLIGWLLKQTPVPLEIIHTFLGAYGAVLGVIIGWRYG